MEDRVITETTNLFESNWREYTKYQTYEIEGHRFTYYELLCWLVAMFRILNWGVLTKNGHVGSEEV